MASGVECPRARRSGSDRRAKLLMLLKKCLFAVALALWWPAADARAEADTFGLGTGRSGPLTLAATGVINTYAPIGQPVAVGAREVSIEPALVQGAPGDFAAGDLVLLWHTIGWTAPVVSGDQTSIDLSANPAAGPAGLWELARIASVTGDSNSDLQTLVLSAPTLRAYAAGESQVVRVPEFTDLVVPAGVQLLPSPFDGRCGGMVALLATGTVTLAASDSIINAGGAGPAGGALFNVPSTLTGCAALDGDPSNGYSNKGASFDVRSGLAASALGGYGNRLSGGGGGNCSNSGGGGGGGASTAKGGKGGNTWSLNEAYGGKGGCGIYGDVRERLLLGGGGGAGEENNGAGSAGGRGGGVIFLRAAALEGAGRIWAYGGDAVAATTDGGGGGGGGGTVSIRISGAATCTRINVRGGHGAASSDGHGPGAGGGAGTIFLQSADTNCDPTALGGNGASNNTHSASAGGAGTIVEPGGPYCGAGVPACPDELPACGSDGVCRPCLASAECPASSPVCDEGLCRKCQENADCPGARCDSASGACVECTADRHCLEASRPVCDSTSRRCRACGVSAECAGRPETQVCAPAGALAGQCVQCTAAESSACVAPTPWCLAPYDDVCVGCLNDDQCPASAPVCDEGDHSCRVCRADTECPSGRCAIAGSLTGTCVACVEDDDCGAGWVCDVAAGRCLGCLDSADCTDPTYPVCRDGACAACSEDADCPESRPACWSSGRCQQCSAGNLSACAEGQRCDLAGRCVDCLDDSHCGAAGSARICEQGSCRDGCRGRDGNGCPPGERCSSTDSTPGSCVAVPDAGQPSDAGPDEERDGGLDGGSDGPQFGAYDLGGCGCAAAPGLDVSALVLLAGLLLRRRR